MELFGSNSFTEDRRNTLQLIGKAFIYISTSDRFWHNSQSLTRNILIINHRVFFSLQIHLKSRYKMSLKVAC